MLFSIKNRLLPTLLLLALFVAGALAARSALGLHWRLAPSPTLLPQVALGLGVILAGDGLMHGLLALLFGERYRERYGALAAYFRHQRPVEMAAGGLLAGGGEELLFRGVLLEGLIRRAGMAAPGAVALSALVFGALHTVRDRRLAPFALWAALQGVLLGCIYLWSGSLLVPMLVHGMHDVIGFNLFAWERRAGKGR